MLVFFVYVFFNGWVRKVRLFFREVRGRFWGDYGVRIIAKYIVRLKVFYYEYFIFDRDFIVKVLLDLFFYCLFII